MDSKRLEEIITCGVCFELFNEDDRCPRILSCGHTFCHSCFEKILEQQPSCPTCQKIILPRKVKLIPINFAVKAMISVVKQEIQNEAQFNSFSLKEADSKFLKLESIGFCDVPSGNEELRCKKDCEAWVCAACGSIQHKRWRILLAEEACKELKVQVYQKLEQEFESRKALYDSITHSLESLEEERKKLENEEKKNKEFDLKMCEKKIEELFSLKSEDYKLCESLRYLGTTAEKSSEADEFSLALSKLEDFIVRGKVLSSHLETLKDHWPWRIPDTIEELRKLCSGCPVYAVENYKDISYGMVEVKNGQIWISSFLSLIPEGHFVSFQILLSRFRGSGELPTKAFLKLAPEGDSNKDIDLVIETDGTSSRSKNFILLCSALKGQKYHGSVLEYKDSSFYELSIGPPPVVEGIFNEEDSHTTWEEGFIVGTGSGRSGFYIALEGDDAEYSLIKFGVVVSGLQKLKEYRGKKLLIIGSGLVI